MAANSNQCASQCLCLGVVTSLRRFVTLGRDLVLQMTTVVGLTKNDLSADYGCHECGEIDGSLIRMMGRRLRCCSRGSSSMQAKVPRHGENHVQEIFCVKRYKKAQIEGKCDICSFNENLWQQVSYTTIWLH